ncbi:MAG: hypothetical protein ACRD0P_09950 [Stackebrandtia sp.]
MMAAPPGHSRPPVLTPVREWHRPLMVNAALMTAVVVVSLVGLAVDDRQLMDESVWIKPLKFGFAFGLYAATLAWLLTLLTRARRIGWWIGTVFAVAGVFDVAAVATAAARGTFSHFNNQDDFLNGLVQDIFKYGVPPLLLTTLVIAVLLLIQRTGDRALSIALRVGLFLAAASMAVAAWLINASWSPARTRVDANGETDTTSLGHGIGDPDGSGMPLTNWSTTGGDLRVPHFIGLHGIQVLLLGVVVLAWLATRMPLLRDDRVRSGLVGTAALGYSGLFAITTWQAQRGQSLIHPDAPTLIAITGVALISLGMALAVLALGRRRASRTAAAASSVV